MDYSLPGHTEKILYISDMKGNQVLTYRFSGQQLTIPVNQLTSGVYLAYIFAHGQVMVREKVVMERNKLKIKSQELKVKSRESEVDSRKLNFVDVTGPLRATPSLKRIVGGGCAGNGMGALINILHQR